MKTDQPHWFCLLVLTLTLLPGLTPAAVPSRTELALPLGLAATGTISLPGQQDRFTFSGTVGQRLYYDTLRLTNSALQVQLLAPSGSTAVGPNGALSAEPAPFYLLESGSYTLVVSGLGDGVGSYHFRVLDVNVAPLITPGPTNRVILNPSAETEIYRFAGSAGQRLRLSSLTNSSDQATWALIDPANQTVASASVGSDLGTNLLPLTGTYLVVVAGTQEGGAAMDFRFRITDVSEAPVTPSGFNVVHSGTLGAGQTSSFSYSASAGTVVYYDSQVAPNSAGIQLRLFGPDGQPVSIGLPEGTSDLGPFQLPRSGVYTLQLTGTWGGGYSFRLLNAATDALPLIVGNTNTGAFNSTYRTDLYRFEGTPGERVYLDTLDPAGNAVSMVLSGPTLAWLWSSYYSTDSGLLSVPAPGTCYLALQPTSSDPASRYCFRFLDLAQAPAQPLAFNTLITNTLVPGSRTDMFRFDGTAGQRLFFDGLGGSGVNSWNLVDPVNTCVYSMSFPDDFTVTLPRTGTYALLQVNIDTNPVAYAFRVLAPPATDFALTLGAVTTGTLTSIGEEHRYTFTGSAGQRLLYDALQNDFRDISVRLLDPEGEVIGSAQNYCTENGTLTLGEPGLYTLVVGGLSDSLGTYSFRLIDAGQAPVLPLNFNTLYSGSNTVSLGATVFRFTGAAGQRLFFDSQATESGSWQVFSPNNTPKGSYALSSDFELNLTEDGTYLLVLESADTNWFGYNFRVRTPGNSTNTLVTGSAVSNAFMDGGDEHRFTFTATPGQRLYYDALDAEWRNATVTLTGPNGTAQWSGNSQSDYGPFTLMAAGTYSLVQHNGTDHGTNYSFRLLDVAAQPALSLGATVTGSLTPKTQVNLYRLEGVAGQRIHLDSLGASSAGATWALYGPDNASLGSTSINFDLGDVFLPASGTYLLAVQGFEAGAGSLNYQIQVSDISDGPVAAAGFGVYSGSVTWGATNLIHFRAAAGTPLYLDSLTNNNAANVSLFDTNGAAVFVNLNASQGTTDPGLFILPSSGIYTLRVEAYQGGDYSFRLLNLNTDALPLNLGARCAGALLQPFQAAVYAVDGLAGHRYLYDGLEGDHNETYVKWISPRGSDLIGGGNWWYYNADVDAGPLTLSESGRSYLAMLSGQAQTNHYAFRLLDLNQAPTLVTSLGVTNGVGLPAVPSTFLSLTGSYFNLRLDGVDEADWRVSGSLSGTRLDAGVQFFATNWGSRAQVGLTGGTDDNWQDFSVQWDGSVTITNAGTRLYVFNYGSSRLWIDLNQDLAFDASECVSNSWGNGYYHSGRGSATPPLAPGTYRLRLQFVSGYSAQAALLWDNGCSVGPYEALVFRFPANAGPLFFDSFQSADMSWSHYRPGSDYFEGGAGSLADFESYSDQPGTNLVVLYNFSDSAQPYRFRILAPATTNRPLALGTVQSTLVNAGQECRFTFTASAGQRLYYDALDPAEGNATLGLTAPGGSLLLSTSHYADSGPVTLTESGTYTLLLHNHLDTTLSWNFRLLDVDVQPSLSLDATNSLTVTLGTQAQLLRFPSLAHLSLYVDSLTGPLGGNWFVCGPGSEVLASSALGTDMQVQDPPVSGPYLLVLSSPETNSYTASFRIVPGNHAPVLAPLSNRTINELTACTFTNTATDLESDNQRLTFSLASPAPEGASIDPVTGVFSWTPSEAQGPGLYSITICVTDDGIPPLADNKTFTLTVSEVNQAPTLTVPGLQTVNELSTLAVSVSAMDLDEPANALAFSLLSPPAGMTINPTNGLITWTPTEAQGPSTQTVSVVVTDTSLNAVNAQHLSITNWFTVVVQEVNSAPSLAALPDRMVNAGQMLQLTVSAADTDWPANALSYALVSPPAGAGINLTNGQFSWRPTVNQADSTNLIQVQVTDDNPWAVNARHLSDTKSFQVVVNALDPVTLTPVSWSNGRYQMRVGGSAGLDYTLLSSTNLTHWTSLYTTNPASTPFLLMDTNATPSQPRFYRVLLGP